MTAHEDFKLPEYLEPWRSEIEAECGGCSVEELINDHGSNGFNNPLKCALIAMADTKVRLLARLHKRGQLVLDPDQARQRWEQEVRERLEAVWGVTGAQAAFMTSGGYNHDDPVKYGKRLESALEGAFEAILDSIFEDRP